MTFLMYLTPTESRVPDGIFSFFMPSVVVAVVHTTTWIADLNSFLISSPPFLPLYQFDFNQSSRLSSSATTYVLVIGHCQAWILVSCTVRPWCLHSAQSSGHSTPLMAHLRASSCMVAIHAIRWRCICRSCFTSNHSMRSPLPACQASPNSARLVRARSSPAFSARYWRTPLGPSWYCCLYGSDSTKWKNRRNALEPSIFGLIFVA
mmetsp:Transcript_93805/g.162417  ORF Transcript_93805/g.162417 Transcript_93805/m.162417 type:complete len:206 (+) Transcript_93805:658-1275(+)